MARSPPTTISFGFSSVTSVASASPISSPASAIARGRAAVAAARQLEQARDGDVGAEQARDGARAGDHLQAAAVAAAADRPVARHAHVAELARDPELPPNALAAEDEPEPDARRQPHVGHLVDALPGAEDVLAERAEVGVVLEAHRQAEPPRHLRDGSTPPHDGRMPSAKTRPCRASTGAASAIADADHMLAVDLRALERARDSSCGEVHALVRGVVDVDRRVLVAEEVAGEVADGDAQVLVAHVDADRERGARDERHQHRRAAALARRRRPRTPRRSPRARAPP